MKSILTILQEPNDDTNLQLYLGNNMSSEVKCLKKPWNGRVAAEQQDTE